MREIGSTAYYGRAGGGPQIEKQFVEEHSAGNNVDALWNLAQAGGRSAQKRFHRKEMS
jgi:hypothetical protein